MTDVGHLAEIADGFLDVVDAVGNEVTKEKVKAIGARNRLQTIAKEREAQVNIIVRIMKLQYKRNSKTLSPWYQMEKINFIK